LFYKSYPHLGKNKEEVIINMKIRDELRKKIPTAIYKLEMKIEEEKRVLKELTALEAIDREIKEFNKEIQTRREKNIFQKRRLA